MNVVSAACHVLTATCCLRVQLAPGTWHPARRLSSAENGAAMKDMILEYIKNEYIDEDEADDIKLDENTPLISSGIVDSFSMVSLKRFLEKKYAISIPDEEASPEAFNTVASIIALVNKHVAKKK
jgi:acyl carrier protein